MRQTIISSERQYTVSIHKAGMGGKPHYGLNISVTGERKAKVMREARQMLEEVQRYAIEVHDQFFGKAEEPEGKSEKDEE